MTPEQTKAKDRERAKAYYWAHRDERRAFNSVYRDKYPERESARQKTYRSAHLDKATQEGRAYRAANPEKMRALYKSYRETHPEECRDGWKAWYAIHREEVIVKARAWRRANPEIIQARAKAYYERNKEALAKKARENPHIGAASTAKRNAAQQHATPVWADHVAIKAIYIDAARLTRQTGVRHEVDHIYPIQGRTVCGLHVACNLQILTKEANQQKSNK